MLNKASIMGAALVASLVAASSGSADPNSHVPVPGANCQGQLMAISNDSSGLYGASGNANASAGPGYFMHSSTHDGIAAYVDSYCTA